ncbi:Fc.00g104890.m01.CDS01 [Cosmosporella sp. VM-42]
MAETLTKTPKGPKTTRQQGAAQGTSYAYERFNSRKQLGKILLVGISRWLLTAALGASIYIILWHYSSRDVLPIPTKHQFNALVVGLSIGLGLNIANSLTSMAGEVRWWILSLRAWPVQEAMQADLIMQAEKLTHVTHLGWVSSCYWIRAYAVGWLLINVASQIALATLGLTYSTNPSNWTTITKPGNVTIPDMSSLETGRVVSSRSQALSALRYTANSYGTVALGWVWGALDDIPKAGTLWNDDEPLVYCGASACRYVFQETTPDDKNYELSVNTNRSVEISGRCDSWLVLRGGDGTEANITIADGNQSRIGLPGVSGVDQTTFMVDTSTEHGTSWSTVSAFESSTTDPWYYRCNISIGPVLNRRRQEHDLGVNVTSLASSAIALQGYGASTLGRSNNTYQYQSYPAESSYGTPQNGSVEGMGTLMAGFATGVVAITAQANRVVTVPGLQPQKSVTLDISKWKYVHIILGLTLVLQLLLELLVAIIANKVLMRDDSHLSTAALLRPALEKVGDRGLISNGKEIASMFSLGTTLTYTSSTEGTYYLRLSP